MRQITYAQAINEALSQAMELSDDVMVIGQLVDSVGVFGTTTGLVDRFGPARVHDFPVAENLMTSVGLGSALLGMRPVLVHQRLDFMMYAVDPIVNWLSLWRFKSAGSSSMPVTIRAIVGRGWGQGPQHSKSLHAWFAHLPGLQVALPATPFDVKGLLLESVFGENPTLILENRSLFSMVDDVPEDPYRVRFGQAKIRRYGSDVTLVTLGATVPMGLRVADKLEADSIDVEVIDLRTVSPIDKECVLESVSKTRRLAVADMGWESVGVASEIIAFVCEKFGNSMLANPTRICLPNSHTPMSEDLEKEYYFDEQQISSTLTGMFT